MPRHLFTQKELRGAQDPGFCYACGLSWMPESETSRDHVPPRALFDVADRTPPLILRTHFTCNNGRSTYDEQISQLVSLCWKRNPVARDVSALRISTHSPQGMTPFVAIEGLRIVEIVGFWLKAFHAALYRTPVPARGNKFFVHSPFPGGDRPGQDTNIHRSQLEYVRTIKENRMVGRLDSICAYNGKLRYECTWALSDEKLPMCIWALDLYAWDQLADIHNFPKRSCVGWYSMRTGIPEGASRATGLIMPALNLEPLNAFED